MLREFWCVLDSKFSGVYMTTIDPQQQKVTVTGNLDADTLIKKLVKSGKHAELWPEKKDQNVTNNNNNNNKADKVKQNNDQKPNEPKPKGKDKVNAPVKKPEKSDNKNGPKTTEDKNTPNNPPDGVMDSSEADANEEDKGKKKKGKNGGGGGGPNGPAKPIPIVGQEAGEMGQAQQAQVAQGPQTVEPNMRSCGGQPMYPYHPAMHLPQPVYGICYNMAQPSFSASRYASPVYGYMHTGSDSLPPLSGPVEGVCDYDHQPVYYDDEPSGCFMM